uniref:Uncharacterized protein n=1 Tax=Sipha flava TaxID=143950 RepID=A0A2S2R578_9HEMI
MDVDQEETTSQEDIRKQQILIQNKEKKIKFIRILTVIAYLVSVSTVATMLSAYYIFIWNPHTGNFTQTPNAERIVMALQRASGEYAFVNAADHEYSGKLYPKSI